MSLNIDISRIADHDSVCFMPTDDGTRQWKPITTRIGFTTMVVDIGDITEENAEEFYCRASLISDIYSSASMDPEIPLTLDEIRAHIGMRTNVVTLTRKQWLAKVTKTVIPNRMREYQWRLDRAKAPCP
jgi:hypothetical protein